MKTGSQFQEDMTRSHKEVYLMGRRLEHPVENPILLPSLRTLALTYDVAFDPQAHGLGVRQGLHGAVNAFCSLHLGLEDLVSKVQLLRLLGQKTGTCFQRCVGWDALNALYSVTYDLDERTGSDYHQRFRRFLAHVQEEDLVCTGAMTDVKGNRSLRPGEQADPDLYLHVVKQTPEGVVVRGAKAHQTGSVFAHEVIVMPTRALLDSEREYAISFAVPSDSPGLVYIVGRQVDDVRRLERSEDWGSDLFGGHESLVVFDDVFVPQDRIFLNGETSFVSSLVERFSAYHRQSYGGCKVGVADVLIGAAALAAEYNGTERAHQIQHKLADMVYLNETLFSCGLACSTSGTQTPSGNYLVDPLLANVCKLNVTRFPYEIARLAVDIAGGLIATLPSQQELQNPRTGPLVDKYLRGAAGYPTADRIKILQLIESMAMGNSAVHYLTESLHGAGSPEAQTMTIGRSADLERKKGLAKALAHISPST
jgi:4-hydroxybutyryl-CoA dehydratase/vinylacetyl-CoA-Delta-isomerase